MQAWARRVIRFAGVWAERTRSTATWTLWPLPNCFETYEACYEESNTNPSSSSFHAAFHGGIATSYDVQSDIRIVDSGEASGAGTAFAAASGQGRRSPQFGCLIGRHNLWRCPHGK